MKYFLYCLKHYVDFNGRAPRAEFWYFVLFNFIIALVVSGVGYAIGFDKLGSLYSLLVLLPALAVSVRRLQDIGKSGWFILVGLIPLVGVLILIYFYVQDSQPGENQYGANPKDHPAQY